MSYIDTLTRFVSKGECPGCGPTLKPNPEIKSPERLGLLDAYCECCGWHVIYRINKTIPYDISILGTGSLETVPIPILEIEENRKSFTCASDHPEHRDRWPKPESDDSQPDEYTEEELEQETRRSDPRHYYTKSEQMECSICLNKSGAHRVVEEVFVFTSPLNSTVLCCECFKTLFGVEAHNYPVI
jgi:hypothetical protein